MLQTRRICFGYQTAGRRTGAVLCRLTKSTALDRRSDTADTCGTFMEYYIAYTGFHGYVVGGR